NTALSSIGEAVSTSNFVTVYEMFNNTIAPMLNNTNVADLLDNPLPQIVNYIELDIHHAIRLYYQAFISVTGIVANILALIVTLSKRMRKHSTCLYMSAIGGSDALTLVISFVWWVSRYVNTTSVWSCKLILFSFYYAIHFSVTLLVAMTAERYVAIRFPFWAHVHLTRRKSVYIIIGVAMAILALDVPNLFTRTMITNEVTGSTRCLFSGSATLDMPYGFFLLYVWQWLDASVYSFFPLTMLGIFNVLIIHTVRKRATTMRNLAEHDNKSAGPGVTQSRTEQQITVMLLVVTFAFIALTTPIAVTLILEKSWTPPKQAHGKAIWRLWRTIVSNLMYTNHAINFLLYSLSSQKFRREVIRLLPCCTVAPKMKGRSSATAMAITSSSTASVSHNEVTVSVIDTGM
ncbi:MAG: G-protein coupled receptor, partial [Chromatiales bacterium]